MTGDASTQSSWSGSFDRETFTVVLGDFVRDMLPALLERPNIRERYQAEADQRTLAQFELDEWGRLSVHAVGVRDRFVLHAHHEEFEFVAQVALVDESTFDALRIASFHGDLMAALVWCRGLLSSIRSKSSDSVLDRVLSFEPLN